MVCVVRQAWRCARARADLHKRKAALPRQLAHKAWMRLMAAAQRAAWQQRLQEVRLQEAALTIQAAYRGWQVRRVTAKQLAGVRRFQVREVVAMAARGLWASARSILLWGMQNTFRPNIVSNAIASGNVADVDASSGDLCSHSVQCFV